MANRKIVLDAGHCYNTAGKRCPDGIREWSLNNAVCNFITEGLAPYGVEVIRTDDTTGQTDISLSARVNKYTALAGSILCCISIHHNANTGTWNSATGVEVYTDKSYTSDDNKLANLLAPKISAKTGLRNRGVKRADFQVINQNKVTAVLCEGGFMDGTNDYKVITSTTGQKAYADAVVEAVVEMYGLTKTTSTTTATTNGNTYKVVKTINKYSSADDAKAQTNSKGTYEPGTYYIYDKYPNGYNGMYNISAKTSTAAGSWINPVENAVATATTTTTSNLYRVRISWADAKSQKGAYASLDNAKKCCQDAGAGYHVFDSNGNCVYSYTAPTTTTPTTPTVEEKKEETPKTETTTTTQTAVYDLDYPVKTKIVDKTVSRTNKDCVKAIKYILANNSAFDIEIAKAFFKLAPIYGIDPVMAISQSILETGWFKYAGSAVTAEQHNYCGLGVTSNGTTGGVFATIEEGVSAQLQHLFAYGCNETLPSSETLLDPRFKYVTRGIAPYWQNLAGRWAVPGYDNATYSTPQAAMEAGNTYGQKIKTLADKLVSTSVTDEDVEKYFPTQTTPTEQPEDKPKEDTKVTPDENKTEIDKDKVNSVLALIEKILKAIINFFSKS